MGGILTHTCGLFTFSQKKRIFDFNLNRQDVRDCRAVFLHNKLCPKLNFEHKKLNIGFFDRVLKVFYFS